MLGKTSKTTSGDTDDLRAGSVINTGEKLNMEHIIGFDALYNSAMKCRRNVMWKNTVAHYILNIIEETIKLEQELHDGTYKERKPALFTITYPKRREILSIVFRDRVYQRSLNDNAIYPQMTKTFVYDNWACQRGKGTSGAIDRLEEHLHRSYRKRGTDGYVLQIDIHGYYPNMRHSVATEKFRKELDPNTFAMAEKILNNQYPGEVGYNPGSQMIQIAGIAVLDELDHFIKERLRIKHYVRYMDDLILIHHDRDYLQKYYDLINNELAKLGFEYNPTKTRIYKIRKGIIFLGFTFRLTDTGKVLILVKHSNVKHEKKKLRKLVRLVKEGKLTRAKADDCYQAWKAHLLEGTSYLVSLYMDEYYNSLWR